MNDRREGKRVHLHHHVLVEGRPGAPLRKCVMIDVGEDGARLMIENPEELPPTFTLLLSKAGFPRRRCRVSWRSREVVGVSFEFDDLLPSRSA